MVAAAIAVKSAWDVAVGVRYAVVMPAELEAAARIHDKDH